MASSRAGPACASSRAGPAPATRAPGSTSHSQDSTPLILFIGQVARGDPRARGVSGDRLPPDVRRHRQMGRARSTTPRRIPEILSRAFHTATGGRPGPVVLALPEDMLERGGRNRRRRALCADRGLSRRGPDDRSCAMRWPRAERPLVLLGGNPWDAEFGPRIWRPSPPPMACRSPRVFRRQDRFDNAPSLLCRRRRHRHQSEARAAHQGCRSSARRSARGSAKSTTGGYTLIDIPTPRQRLIHVHPDPEELGRVYRPFLAINAAPRSFAAALAALPPLGHPPLGERNRGRACRISSLSRAGAVAGRSCR